MALLGVALLLVSLACLIYVSVDTRKGIDAGGCLPTIAVGIGVLCGIFGLSLFLVGVGLIVGS